MKDITSEIYSSVTGNGKHRANGPAALDIYRIFLIIDIAECSDSLSKLCSTDVGEYFVQNLSVRQWKSGASSSYLETSASFKDLYELVSSNYYY